MRKTRQQKARDKLIEGAYRATCTGMINVMDIGKIFAEGHRLIDGGANFDMLCIGIRAFVDQLTKETA